MFSPHHIRLSELNLAIKEAISVTFDEPVWIVAEIARINANYSGHTYIDLVEKRGAETLAQAKATVWRSNSRMLAKFAETAGQPLKPGSQVLMLVTVDFHPVYGLSLNVQEIDPNYSLGEMARRRQEVIDRLKREELIDRNRELPLALVPQRIAVISSATAAGWEDFRSRLEGNPYGYTFSLSLVTAVMQGDGAEASIIAALRRVQESKDEFDAVAIIRGGGGVVDLSCFDSYLLSAAIATFPVPVITGIGHERDTAVADIVSFHRADTPTAAAEFLIARVGAYDVALTDATERVVELAVSLMNARRVELAGVTAGLLERANRKLHSAELDFNHILHRVGTAVRARSEGHHRTITEIATRISLRTRDCRTTHTLRLDEMAARLTSGSAACLYQESTRLDRIETLVRTRTPEEVLRLGFTITRLNGKALKSAGGAAPGSVLETTVSDGTIKSRVEDRP